MAKLDWGSENTLYYYGIIFNSEEGEIDLEDVRKSFDEGFDDAAEHIVELVNNDMDKPDQKYAIHHHHCSFPSHP